jgi:hypothetical protein
VVQVIISNNHKTVVGMSKSTITNYAITMYDLETSQNLNEFEFSGHYIKAVEIQ